MANKRFSLFGWNFVRDEAEEEKIQPSFTEKEEFDGAVVVAAGGVQGTYVDLEGTARTEAELVNKYREVALNQEVESAIEDIVNESISTDDEELVAINLEKLPYRDAVKDVIRDEFEEILRLFNFNNNCYEIFRRWYVDGRLYYHVMINEDNPSEGIKEVRYVDPRKIRKVTEIKKEKQEGISVVKHVNEYFIYNNNGFLVTGTNTINNPNYGDEKVVRIANDSIIHITSGMTDPSGRMIYSHLQKAIKPLNQLRVLEDAVVIYRISRAPERRIFYIDVGSLPKMKAEQYLRDMMVKHKNKLVYDSKTGEIRDDRKYMTMLEDYWLPRREGNKGTEISTLPAGQNLGQMEDVLYFQKKLYRSLNVPISRLEPEQGFSLGRSAEISRDEVKFAKFVDRLRKRFSQLFLKALEKQLVLKGVMSIEDWDQIKNQITFDYAIDNHYAEFKEAELFDNRVQALDSVTPYIGKLYSLNWIRKNVLKMSDDQIEQMKMEIAAERDEMVMLGFETPMSDGENDSDIDGDGSEEKKNQMSSRVINRSTSAHALVILARRSDEIGRKSKIELQRRKQEKKTLR